MLAGPTQSATAPLPHWCRLRLCRSRTNNQTSQPGNRLCTCAMTRGSSGAPRRRGPTACSG
eukprot:9658676-Alexandrium_andersonii.AAC.1